MRKALCYLIHSQGDEFIRSEDLTGLNFSLIDIADALDDLIQDDKIPQRGRRFVASIVDLLDKECEQYYAVFRHDVGMSPGGGFEMRDMDEFSPGIGSLIDVSDRSDNLAIEAEYLDDGRIVATGDLLVEAKYARSLAVYLRGVEAALH